MKEAVHAFLDTNVFMHYPRIDSIEWCKHLGATTVIVVIDDQVIRELDSLKDGGKGAGRRKRARDTLSFLSTFLEATGAQELRANVTVQARLEAATVDLQEARLDPRNQDDAFLAGVLTFAKEHANAEVVVVAGDLGVRLKAKRLGLRAMDPSSFAQRQEIQSDDEKELLQLRRQVAELQGRAPKLEFGLLHRGGLVSHLPFQIDQPAAQELTEDELERMVAGERAKLTEDFRDNPLYSRSDLRDYFGRVEGYLEDVAEYLWFDNMLSSGIDVVVRFGIRNAGAAAHRVSVDLAVPEARLVELLEDKDNILADERRRPEAPDPPEPTPLIYNPLTGMFTDSFPMPYIPVLPVEVRPEPDIERLYTEGKAIHWYLPALRGGEVARSDRIWMVLPASCASGFSITAMILSTEAPRLDISLQVSFKPSPEEEEGSPEPPSLVGES